MRIETKMYDYVSNISLANDFKKKKTADTYLQLMYFVILVFN